MALGELEYELREHRDAMVNGNLELCAILRRIYTVLEQLADTVREMHAEIISSADMSAILHTPPIAGKEK